MDTGIKFLGYHVREMKFLKNDNFKAAKVNLKLNFSKNSTYLDNNRIRLNIHVKIFEDAVANNFPFDLSFIVSGFFQYNEMNIEDDQERERFEAKLMEILYPYIRTIVSNIMTATNLPPIILPTIDINFFVRNSKNKI